MCCIILCVNEMNASMCYTDTLTYGAASQPLPTMFSPSGDFTAGMHDSVNVPLKCLWCSSVYLLLVL